MGGFIAWLNQNPVAWIVPLVILGVIVYFLPTIVADKRKHNNKLAIFILNLFMLFTGGIAWIVALVWACTDNTNANNAK